MWPDYIIVCLSLSLSREREEVEGTPLEKLSWDLFYQYHHLFCKLKTKEIKRLTSACLDVNILDKSLAMLQVKQLSL